MHLLCCLVVSLLVSPVVAYAAPLESGAPVVEGAAPAVPVSPVPPASRAIQTQQALLEQRVTARWDALIHRDFETAYSFTSPSYRALFPLNAFKGQFGESADWRRIEVVTVDFKGEDAATVGINLYFGYYHSGAEKPEIEIKTYVQEPWVSVDGQWWYVMKN